MSGTAGGQSPQVIAPLESGNHPSLTTPCRHRQKLVRGPGVVGLLELQTGQWIGLMGVESGRKEQKIWLEGVERRQDAIRHRSSKFGRAGVGPQRRVADIADPRLLSSAGPRIEGHLMGRGIEQSRV